MWSIRTCSQSLMTMIILALFYVQKIWYLCKYFLKASLISIIITLLLLLIFPIIIIILIIYYIYIIVYNLDFEQLNNFLGILFKQDFIIYNLNDNLEKTTNFSQKIDIYTYLKNNYINKGWDHFFLPHNDISYVYTRLQYNIDLIIVYNYLIEIISNYLNMYFHLINKIYIYFIIENTYISKYIIKRDIMLWKINQIYSNNYYNNNLLELFSENYKIKLYLIKKKSINNNDYIFIDVKKKKFFYSMINQGLIKKYKLIHESVFKMNNVSQEMRMVSTWIYKNISKKYVFFLWSNTLNINYYYYCLWQDIWEVHSKALVLKELEYKKISPINKEYPVLRTIQRFEALDLYRQGSKRFKRFFNKVLDAYSSRSNSKIKITDDGFFVKKSKKRYINHTFNYKIKVYHSNLLDLVKMQEQNHPIDVLSRVFLKTGYWATFPIHFPVRKLMPSVMYLYNYKWTNWITFKEWKNFGFKLNNYLYWKIHNFEFWLNYQIDWLDTLPFHSEHWKDAHAPYLFFMKVRSYPKFDLKLPSNNNIFYFKENKILNIMRRYLLYKKDTISSKIYWLDAWWKKTKGREERILKQHLKLMSKYGYMFHDYDIRTLGVELTNKSVKIEKSFNIRKNINTVFTEYPIPAYFNFKVFNRYYLFDLFTYPLEKRRHMFPVMRYIIADALEKHYAKMNTIVYNTNFNNFVRWKFKNPTELYIYLLNRKISWWYYRNNFYAKDRHLFYNIHDDNLSDKAYQEIFEERIPSLNQYYYLKENDDLKKIISAHKFYKKKIDFKILLKKYFTYNLHAKNIKKFINHYTIKYEMKYLIGDHLYKFKKQEKFYAWRQFRYFTREYRDMLKNESKAYIAKDKYLYNYVKHKIIFKNIKKNSKIIYLYFNSLYYDVNIGEFKINKNFMHSIVDMHKTDFNRKINLNINKNLINYDVYTKIHKKNILKVEKLFEIEETILNKNIVSGSFLMKSYFKDLYKPLVWRITDISPTKKIRRAYPRSWRSWFVDGKSFYNINLQGFLIDKDYVINNVNYYKKAFTNILYYITNPKLKIYEINNKRYRCYPTYLFENNENIKMYGKPKNLKFFGGYTFWYEYFQDYDFLNKYNKIKKTNKYITKSLDHIEIYKIAENWHKYYGLPTWLKRNFYNARGRWLYTVPLLEKRWSGFRKYKISSQMFLYLSEYKKNNFVNQKIKKYFISSLFSDDIWDLKKFKIKYMPPTFYNYLYKIELFNKLKFKQDLVNYMSGEEQKRTWKFKLILKELYTDKYHVAKSLKDILLMTFERYYSKVVESIYFDHANFMYEKLNEKKPGLPFCKMMRKINSFEFIKYKFKLKYFLLDHKTNIWVKDILIRRPKLKQLYLYYPRVNLYGTYKVIEQIAPHEVNVYHVPNFIVKKEMHRIFTRTGEQFAITSYKAWLKWLLKFNVYYKVKEPILLRIFANLQYRWAEKQEGWIDISYSNILKISKKAKYLLNFTKEYNKDRISKLKSFWVKEFSKDFIYGNKMKFFILEKLKSNKILIKEKHLFIKEHEKSSILNILIKKYYINLNKLNKDNIFYISQIKDKKLEYNNKEGYNNIYFWKKNFYKKKIFYKKFFWENYYTNVKFMKLNCYTNLKFYQAETLWDVEKDEDINFYYKIHFVSLNLNILKHINNFTKINLKNEYFNSLINLYQQEELEYEIYFLLKNRKNILINYILNLNKYINNIFIYLNKNIIKIFDKINNKYVYLIILIFVIIIIYISLIIFIIFLIKSNTPINNIFGIKTIFKKNKNKNDKIMETITSVQLKNILEEDITFGTEQKYVYSLTDKKNAWTKVKLYNKYTKKVKEKINKNYEVLYKNFIFEENLKKIENNVKLKIPFENFIYFWNFFKNNIEKIKYIKLALKFLNDRFYNYGRFVKTESAVLNSEDLPHTIKMPRSVIWQKTSFYLKVIFGSFFIWLKYMIRRVVITVNRKKYFEYFRTQLIIKKKTTEDIKTDLKKFFIRIKEKKVLKWYLDKMDFLSLEEPFKKEKINFNLEISNIELEETYDLYLGILTYLYENKYDEEEEKIPLFEFIYRNLIKREKMQEVYIEHLYNVYKNVTENKIEIWAAYYDEDLQLLNLELQYIDFMLFDLLLNIIENKNLKNNVIEEMEIIQLINELKNIDWKSKNYNLYKLKLEKLIKGKDFRLIKELSDYKEKKKVLYIMYRYFTTIGSRFYYLWSLIITLSIIWINSINKFKRENYNMTTLIKIFLMDIQKFIIKDFWEYTLLEESNFNVIKNYFKNNIKFVKDIIIFTLIIISPLSIYIFILVLLYIIYCYIYILYIKFKDLIEKATFRINLIYIKKFKKLAIIINVIKFIISCIIFLFKDLKTGDTIFTKLYIYIYIKLGDLQENIYIIKNYYIEARNQNISKKKIIYNLLIWRKLKLYVWIDTLKQKKSYKLNLKEKINNLQKKKIILMLMFNNNSDIKNLKFLLLDVFKDLSYIILSKYIIIYLDKIIYDIIYLKWTNSMEQKFNKFINYKLYIKESSALIISKIKYHYMEYYMEYNNIYKELQTTLEKSLFWIQIILIILFLPITITIKIYKAIMLMYYEIPWHRKKWRFKYSLSYIINETLRTNIISSKLWAQKELDIKWRFEEYLEEKAKYERSIPKLRAYLEKEAHWNYGYKQAKPLFVFWSKIAWWKLYKYYVNFRHQQLVYWYNKIYEIERIFIYYSRKRGTQHMSLYRRLFKVRKLLKKKKKRNKKWKMKIKELTREKFFKRKLKDRKKILRRYFIKGLINWIWYILTKKVIFKEVKELKKQRIFIKALKYKKFKYQVANVNIAIHISARLEKVEPQLWMLTILYEYYYKNIMQNYILKQKPVYHKTPQAPRTLQVKWKIHPHFGHYDLAELYRTSIANTSPLIKGEYLLNFAKRKPDNLLFQYILYIIEALSEESWSNKKTWYDISNKFGLTYNSIDDNLKYEGKETLTEDDDIIQRIARYDLDSPLLLERFNHERRLKTAFMFKLASVSTIFSTIRDTVKGIDDLEIEKKEAFDYFWSDYNPTWGYETRHLDLKSDWELSWDNDKYLIHFLTIDTIYTNSQEKKKRKKKKPHLKDTLDQLFDFVSIIFYDICLVEMINSLFIYITFKRKELLYIKTINISIEPSINIPISYNQFDDERYVKETGEMQLDPYIDNIYMTRLFDKRKIITFDRQIDEDDILVKFEDVKLKFWTLGSKDIIEEDTYESGHSRELFELKHKYQHDDAILQIIMEQLDIVYTWQMIISDTYYEVDDEFNNDILLWNLAFLENKWGRRKYWWEDLEYKRQVLNDPILYLNILKLSIVQWLHMDIIEKEKLKLYKSNTILFNERYNIYYIELLPIRVQLPIKLEIDFKETLYTLSNLTDWSSADMLLHPWWLIQPYTKYLMLWQSFRKHLIKSYQRSLLDIFYANVDKSESDKETIRLSKKYKEYYQALRYIGSYNYFVTDLVTIVRIGWDWVLYHKQWTELEEFTHADWFVMRLKRQARDSMEVRAQLDYYPWTLYVIFNPLYFINIFGGFWKYTLMKYAGILSLLWSFFELMYSPGELFVNSYYVIVPFWWGIYFLFLWFYIRKDVKKMRKNEGLFLYKYQAVKNIKLKARLELFKWTSTEREILEEHVDIGEGNESNVWKTNRYTYVETNFNTFYSENAMPVIFFGWWTKHIYSELWRWRKYSGWHYKRRDLRFKENKLGKFSNTYTRRHEKTDVFVRLEKGSNVYNHWYIHVFRKNKGLKRWIIDKGLYKEERTRFDFYYFFNKRYAVRVNMDISDLCYYYYSMKTSANVAKLFWMRRKTKSGVYDPENTFGYLKKQNGFTTMKLYSREKFNRSDLKLKSDLRKIIRGKKKFIDWFEHYDLIEPHHEFITVSKHETLQLIIKNRNEYYSYHSKSLYAEKIHLIKKNAYNTLEPIPFNHLISITTHEKHANIMWYNLMKYKYYRHFSLYYNNFNQAKEHLNFILTYCDKELILNIKLYYNKIDWGNFLWKLYKLKYYIINFNKWKFIDTKKLELFIDIFAQKLKEHPTLYGKICWFIKTVYPTWEEVCEIIVLMIKLLIK